MSTPPSDELERTAREHLASGATAPEVLVKFLEAGAAPAEAAVAVCVAAGSPRAEAERRLEGYDGLWDLIEEGEEADVADLLAMLGYFEPDAELSDDEREIVARLGAIYTTVDGVPSGYAVSLSEHLRTGRLVKAFLQLEWLGGVRWRGNKAFWTAMCRAGEAFTEDDAALDTARDRCRERMAGL